jgi:hypothetical protein
VPVTAGGVVAVPGEVGLFRRADRGKVHFAFRSLRLQLKADEVRNCDGGQNTDDGDNDHQLDERKALLALPKELIHSDYPFTYNCLRA